MRTGEKIKVLVVDDSIVFREVLSRGINANPDMEVVAKAIDPFDARDKILEYSPDVMICDVQMPKMSGIEFIKRLLPQYRLPVIVVSTISQAVFDAMNAGAVDFVTKPDATNPKSMDNFIIELTNKIKVATKAKVSLPLNQTQKVETDDTFDYKKIIAIGASTGGTEAIYSLLKGLPQNLPGIVIVQHIPPVFSNMFAQRLNNQTIFNVKEAENGDYVEKGKVFIAPGDKHMKIRKIGDKFKIELFEGEKVSGHCPSVDVLFESVAQQAKNNAVGVILTGMGADGAKGLFSMRQNGAKTIGQDESSCVVYGMPRVAFEMGAVEKQASLLKIPEFIIKAAK